MEPKGPEWLGLEVIRASDLKPKGDKGLLVPVAPVGVLVRRDGGGVPLAATADDALLWLCHEERPRSMVKRDQEGGEPGLPRSGHGLALSGTSGDERGVR